jgi:hypothetical protein
MSRTIPEAIPCVPFTFPKNVQMFTRIIAGIPNVIGVIYHVGPEEYQM